MEQQTIQLRWNDAPLDVRAPVGLTGPGTLAVQNGDWREPDRVLVQLTDTPDGQGEPEPDQWPGESGQVTAWTHPERNTPTEEVTVTVEQARLTGDFYNGTGYRGHLPRRLRLVLGQGASLEGVISATQVRFDGDGAAHQTFCNGGNEVSVTLRDGAQWTVQGAGYLTSLTVGKGCRFVGTVLLDDRQTSVPKGKTLEGLLLVLPE